jgi:hypothetical protein
MEDVRVPGDHLIGGETQGWQLMGTVLEAEHGGRGRAVARDETAEHLVKYVRETKHNGGSLGSDPVIQQAVTSAVVDAHISTLFQKRVYWMYQTHQEMSFQSNVGLTDETHYTTYASKTDDVGNNGWFDYTKDGTFGASATWDGSGVSFAEGDDRVDFSWYNADGDTGYRVEAGIASKDAMTFGGAYGMTSGDTDMDFGAAVEKAGDTWGGDVHVRSRTLTDSDVTAYSVDIEKTNASIDGAANYARGSVWGGDASKAALTYGPGIRVAKPKGSDLALGVDLVQTNLAGEVTVKDWLGIRGSVTAALSLGESVFNKVALSTTMSTGFGASISTDNVDIDLMLSPEAILGGPHFLTGTGARPPLALSARFDI